jgi:glycosyltransferase involved in cell wall biosynthesis
MRTAILIPCYNEEMTVGKVVADFRLAAPDAVVYVYDNNSTDSSAMRAAEAGAVVVPELRQGKGNVVRSMFRDIQADCYVMVDADDTYPAEDVVEMARLVLDGEADMVVGDRLSSTYFSQNKRRFHGVGNRLVRWLVNRLFGSDLRDIMSGYRCFSRRFVKALPVTSVGFEIETAMTIHALDKGFRIRELPVSYRDRPEGSQSKLDTVGDGLLVLRTIVVLFRDYRPLAFFGITSAAMGVVSLLMFLAPLEDYIRAGYVYRVPTLVVSVALGAAALLSLACGVILESIRKRSQEFYELALTYMDRDGGRRGGER